MTTVELEVPTDAVQDGDELIELRWDRPGLSPGSNGSWKGLTVRNRAVFYPNGDRWGAAKDLKYGPTHRYLVRRQAQLVTSQPMYSGTFTVPAGRVVKDWPVTCPRCGRAEAAVVLFQSVECRHGCFK